jgi:hypothetical protein
MAGQGETMLIGMAGPARKGWERMARLGGAGKAHEALGSPGASSLTPSPLASRLPVTPKGATEMAQTTSPAGIELEVYVRRLELDIQKDALPPQVLDAIWLAQNTPFDVTLRLPSGATLTLAPDANLRGLELGYSPPPVDAPTSTQ